jgi:hypothetical protein
VLSEVYNDPTASPAVRVKAAGLALPHETPRLQSVPPAIDATCEEIVPLADLVTARRARHDRMMLEPPYCLSGQKHGNGSDDDAS